MRTAVQRVHRAWIGVATLCLTLVSTGCGWQAYTVTRSVREVTGAKTRLHVVMPLRSSLRHYRAIEVVPLADLIGERIPPAMETYLNERLMKALSGLPSSPSIAQSPIDSGAGMPTLVVDGFVDDYDAGSRPLRLVELGFNHVAVTVRVRLRDEQSGQLLGAASVTAEDDRASGTTRAAIDHAIARVRAFVETGYAR